MILVKKQQDIAENDIKEALIYFIFFFFFLTISVMIAFLAYSLGFVNYLFQCFLFSPPTPINITTDTQTKSKFPYKMNFSLLCRSFDKEATVESISIWWNVLLRSYASWSSGIILSLGESDCVFDSLQAHWSAPLRACELLSFKLH